MTDRLANNFFRIFYEGLLKSFSFNVANVTGMAMIKFGSKLAPSQNQGAVIFQKNPIGADKARIISGGFFALQNDGDFG